jgi:hypothetical protein
MEMATRSKTTKRKGYQDGDDLALFLHSTLNPNKLGVVTTGYMLSTLITIGDDKGVVYNNSMMLIAIFSISILLGIFAVPIVYNDYNDIVFSSTVSISNIIIPISTVVNVGLILSLVTFFLSVTLGM